MRTKHIEKNDVLSDTHLTNDGPQEEIRPPRFNGYSLSTEQLHRILSGDQVSTCLDSFDKAVLKQRQLLAICNLLDRQNEIHQELEELIHGDSGVLWLDNQLSAFKSLCPTEVLHALSHSSVEPSHRIENSNIINQHFFSLINEHLYSPLLALAKRQDHEMSEHERQEWYEWCLGFNTRFENIKHQIKAARDFFDLKTFDKIFDLAKDDVIRQQFGNMKNLFQPSHIVKHDVECS